MNKDFTNGYNFALDELYNYINWLTTSEETITFRADNGSRGITEEILDYLVDRRR